MEFYEESMPDNTHKDYTIYYVPESMSDFDNLSNIMKKGELFQQQALITNLEKYMLKNTTLFLSVILGLIEQIELWEKETQKLFAKYLYKMCIDMPPENKNFNKFINMTIKHMLVAISSYHEVVVDEYIVYFDKIINFFDQNNNLELTDNKNQKKSIKISFNSDIYEFIISLGKFGQSIKNRRLCSYFCSCIIRIDKGMEPNEKENEKNDLNDGTAEDELHSDTNNNITEEKQINGVKRLLNRFLLLCTNNESEIKREIAHEMRYIIKIVYNENEKYSELTQNIISFLKTDWDSLTQTETVKSIFYNFELIINCKEIIEILFDTIVKMIQNTAIEKSCIIDTYALFINALAKTIDECSNRNIKYVFEKIYESNIINEFYQKYICLEGNIEYRQAYLETFANFNKIVDYIKTHYILIFTNINEIEDLIEIIYDEISDFEILSNNSNYASVFYNCLCDFIEYIPSNKLPPLEDRRRKGSDCSINNGKKCNINENNFYIFKKEFFVYIIKSKNCLKLLIAISKKINLVNYLPIFLNQIEPIKSKLTIGYNQKTSAKVENITDEFQKNSCYLLKEIIIIIYKNPSYNTHKDEIYEKIFKKIQNGLERNCGYNIKSELIKVMPNLIKYSKKREEYLNYLKINYYRSDSFFQRRIFVVFLKECFQTFSIKFILDNFLWKDYINLIKDKIAALSCSTIKIYIEIYFLIKNKYKEGNEEVIKILKEESETKDIEKKKIIQIVLNNDNINELSHEQKCLIENNYIKQNEEKEIFTLEKEKENHDNANGQLGVTPNVIKKMSLKNTLVVQRKNSYIGSVKYSLNQSKSKHLPPVTPKSGKNRNSYLDSNITNAENKNELEIFDEQLKNLENEKSNKTDKKLNIGIFKTNKFSNDNHNFFTKPQNIKNLKKKPTLQSWNSGRKMSVASPIDCSQGNNNNKYYHIFKSKTVVKIDCSNSKSKMPSINQSSK